LHAWSSSCSAYFLAPSPLPAFLPTTLQNLGCPELANMDAADWQNGKNEGILYVAKAGEKLYKVK
jgi:hypothetical protein